MPDSTGRPKFKIANGGQISPVLTKSDIRYRHLATLSSSQNCSVEFGPRSYIPCIYLLNKIDQISIEELDIICDIPHCVPISAHHKWNYDSLLEKLWEYLKLVRSVEILVDKKVLFV